METAITYTLNNPRNILNSMAKLYMTFVSIMYTISMLTRTQYIYCHQEVQILDTLNEWIGMRFYSL